MFMDRTDKTSPSVSSPSMGLTEWTLDRALKKAVERVVSVSQSFVQVSESSEKECVEPKPGIGVSRPCTGALGTTLSFNWGVRITVSMNEYELHIPGTIHVHHCPTQNGSQETS